MRIGNPDNEDIDVNNDLPKHAAAKVSQALNDVHQVARDPGEMLRIAILAAGVCIGQASGIVRGMAERCGEAMTEREAKERVMKLLTAATLDGVEAALKSLQD